MCECCTNRKGRERRITGQKVLARLCDRCANSGHCANACRVCRNHGSFAMVWDCGRVAHVARFHPDLLAIIGNMPEPAPPPQSGNRIIGRIQPEALT